MTTIWKFPIETTDYQSVSMPEGSTILTVQLQGDTPTLWALVDPNAPMHPVRIRTFGTGHPVGHYDLVYIGTYQVLGGNFVFHVFEDRAK